MLMLMMMTIMMMMLLLVVVGMVVLAGSRAGGGGGGSVGRGGRRHQVALDAAGGRGHRLVVRAPVAQVILSVFQYLARLRRVLKRWPHVAWHNGIVVQQVQQPAAVTREDDLLLGALNRGSEMLGVGFLELLAGLQRNGISDQSYILQIGW
jgi:hypothetical protein